ncbi:unnamed protein product [Allacma fusca]|uniref:Uncharacterized protein n=1 Tax=Allacma fusca TaxID=39272 RepID=A0A8J2JX50_9HEXA|nr:unnamed protein product [Allacma fusca]
MALSNYETLFQNYHVLGCNKVVIIHVNTFLFEISAKKMRFKFIAASSYSTILLVLALVQCVKCQDPQPPISLDHAGHPEWHLEIHKYHGSPSDKTIRSDYYSCKRDTVIREIFMQKEQLEVKAYGVPIHWSGFISVMANILGSKENSDGDSFHFDKN